MYIPNHFKQEDIPVLLEFIRKNSFGILFSNYGEVPEATHLPFHVKQEGENIMLTGHFAKANPHWKTVNGKDVLVVFSGPHAYVSASWYEGKNNVPTWNYTAVHVYGQLEIVEDKGELLSMLAELSQFHEKEMEHSWNIEQRTEYVHQLTTGIVGFKIHIMKLEGKWKISQNKPEQERRNIIQGLRAQSRYDSREVADLIERIKK
ncbi:FMN-binding negative transcriptional regulator [Bacillus sp. 165]|uniref:FMN-binding negative transcriptional regulator n=1 Tax=Bacillus sp. 165 TaxID=1529117 RepID=UPI001ADAE83B|nr:FMN-binding negative transcriptional regulator [Bacillus sp. 165]MBO9129888.1 FMN-binding negative transcriptional regulator [Bacillus sp. 165]